MSSFIALVVGAACLSPCDNDSERRESIPSQSPVTFLPFPKTPVLDCEDYVKKNPYPSVQICEHQEGDVPVALSCDYGKSLTKRPSVPKDMGVSEILALDEPGKILAMYSGAIYRSDTGGCTFSKLAGQQNGFQTSPRLVKSSRGIAYGYEKGGHAFRLDRDRYVPLRTPRQVFGLGADPANFQHIRISDQIGQLWDSIDSGKKWQKVGRSIVEPTERLFVRSTVFDPNDINHAIVVTLQGNPLMTTDGGTSWRIVASPCNRWMQVAFSPLDGNVVWANCNTGLLYSTNAGQSFDIVLDKMMGNKEGLGVDWEYKGVWAMLPDPEDVHRVYIRAAYLQLYDAKNHQNYGRSAPGWTALAFSTSAPSLWYIGFAGARTPIE